VSQISVQRDLPRSSFGEGRIRKWANGSSCSFRLPFRHKLCTPAIGAASESDLQAQTQVSGPPASAPKNANRLLIRRSVTLYPLAVSIFYRLWCHLQRSGSLIFDILAPKTYSKYWFLIIRREWEAVLACVDDQGFWRMAHVKTFSRKEAS
jgi:hypothetical protein